MNRVRKIAGVLAVSAVAAVTMAETATTGGTMLRMQPGEAVFTILDTRGVSPLPGSELSIRDMQQGETIVGAVADDAGRAVVELTEGRFIVNVDNINLSVLDVRADADHSECRIVMPSQDMLVGGQAEDDDGDVAAAGITLGSRMMTPVIIGSAVVLVGGVAYAIDEHSSSSSSSTRTVVAEPETIVRTTRRSPVEETVYVPVPVPPPPSP